MLSLYLALNRWGVHLVKRLERPTRNGDGEDNTWRMEYFKREASHQRIYKQTSELSGSTFGVAAHLLSRVGF